jgi:hypothetical protein
MNPNSYIILNDIKKKEYLINDSRLFIKFDESLLGKFEILICSYNSASNHLIPELLMKYKSNIIIFDIILNFLNKETIY